MVSFVAKTVLFCALLLNCVHALHFYLDALERRCFIEELPTDTIVEGHYRAQEWDEKAAAYVHDPKLGVQVNVEEMDTGHVVVKSRGPPEGKFMFTSHESGDHSICLATNYTGSWFSGRHVRMYLDINVGAAKHDADHDRTHVGEVAEKLRGLNDKLDEIKREQRYQREREGAFRDLSESTNSKVVWYCLVQVVVMVITCAWQLRHLRNFFEDRKVR